EVVDGRVVAVLVHQRPGRLPPGLRPFFADTVRIARRPDALVRPRVAGGIGIVVGRTQADAVRILTHQVSGHTTTPRQRIGLGVIQRPPVRQPFARLLFGGKATGDARPADQ